MLRMILRVLLLIRFTCCVCEIIEVNVTQSFYQAEENQNITLEWTFITTDDISPNDISVSCSTFIDDKTAVLFLLHGGVEDSESQDKQFAGRVQWDKDVLKEGRIRLHVSRLKIEDSGWYQCGVITRFGEVYSPECRLNVSAARDQPEPETPNTARTSDVNVTQSSYQAEENQNITMEWTFITTDDISPNGISAFCSMGNDNKRALLFYLVKGVEIPENQDKEFAGRVQWDKDVLKEGRIRLHLSRLKIEDSGRYWCHVRTKFGETRAAGCHLNVTAARDQPEPETPNTASQGRIALYWSLGLTAAAVLPVCCL